MASRRHGAHVAVDRDAVGDDGARALLVGARIDALSSQEIENGVENQALDDPCVFSRIQDLDVGASRG
jgi:hypothetical protein